VPDIYELGLAFARQDLQMQAHQLARWPPYFLLFVSDPLFFLLSMQVSW
jgi:hypothetical protein